MKRSTKSELLREIVQLRAEITAWERAADEIAIITNVSSDKETPHDLPRAVAEQVNLEIKRAVAEAKKNKKKSKKIT